MDLVQEGEKQRPLGTNQGDRVVGRGRTDGRRETWYGREDDGGNTPAIEEDQLRALFTFDNQLAH